MDIETRDGDDELDLAEFEQEGDAPEPEADEDISFEDDEDDSDASQEEVGDDGPDLPRKLRHEIRDRDRRLAAKERELAELRAANVPKPVEVGPRPQLADFDYDEDRYSEAVDAWSDRKVKAALSDRDAAAPDEAMQEDFRRRVDRFQEDVANLPYGDAKAMVEAAVAAMPASLQAAVVQVADDPARLVYALGKYPDKLRALIEQPNQARMMGDIARLEGQMKTGTRKPTAQPQAQRRGDAMPRGGDKELARLQKEADRTGNRTALVRYKKEKGLL